MSDRTARPAETRPHRRRPAPRSRLRPALEGLEGRALMSYGGSPDFSFGTYGFAANAVPAAADYFGPAAIKVQSDGKVLEAGILNVPIAGTMNSTRYLSVGRFNADGTLDSTFGTAGYFTNPALSLSNDFTLNTESANALAIQSNGDIVVVGSNNAVGVAFRLGPDGTLDSAFGTGGIVTLGTQSTNDGKLNAPQSVDVLADGHLAIGGAIVNRYDSQIPSIELLNADGSIASAFATGGLAKVPLPAGDEQFDSNSSLVLMVNLVTQPDGKMILVTNSTPTHTSGVSNNQVLATRFDADGTLDPSFGTAGQVIVNPQTILPNVTDLESATIALQPDGKFVIASSATYTDSGPNFITQPVVLRLDADGTLDTTFGVGGFDILTSPIGSGGQIASQIAPQIAIGPDGKIVLATVSLVTFTRLDPDGLPDPSFGTGGTTSFPTASTTLTGNELSSTVLVQADGKILAIVSGDSGSGLVRMLGRGAVNDFNNDGTSDPAVLNISPSSVSYLPSGGGAVVNDAIGDDGAGLSIPAPGAYSGGGVTEQAVYLTGFGAFDIKPYDGGGDVKTLFGTPGIGNSYPAPGDYDGSGKTELAVYEPATGSFLYRPTYGSKDVTVPFGTPGAGQSIPAPADYFNTGVTDFAVYLVAQGAYEIQNPVTGKDITIPFGTPGAGQSIPVPGDYDGSGHVELAVYVPASGDLIYRPAGGGADVVVPFGVAGIATTLPAPGDYDGSGQAEVAGYLPGDGNFSYLPAAGGAAVVVPLGTANQSLALSLGTDSVTESGVGIPPPSPNVLAPSVDIPLTPDMLDTLAGTTGKKKAGGA